MRFHQMAHRKFCLFIILTLSLLIVVPLSKSEDDTTKADMLVYVMDNLDSGKSLMMFDPSTGEHSLLYENPGHIGFSVSSTGKVAFVAWRTGNSDKKRFFLLNELNPKGELIDLGELFGVNIGLLEWSPDGRYLAFSSLDKDDNRLLYIWDGITAIDITPTDTYNPPGRYMVEWSPDGRYLAFPTADKDNNLLLYIWDGNTVIDITPTDTYTSPKEYWVKWSTDNRLAFIASFAYIKSYESVTNRIYLWNGVSTTRLIQDSESSSSYPLWNMDNELAFISGAEILVWDGISFQNGQPDVNSFTTVSTVGYYSGITWTSEGYLAFNVQTAEDSHVQVYLWDGEQTTNITQNPDFHNGLPRWNSSGLWAFSTFFSSKQLLYVRDADNRTLLTTEGNLPVWSADGYLIFCNVNNAGLSMWNGDKITLILPRWEIWAQWQSGQEIGCTSG